MSVSHSIFVVSSAPPQAVPTTEPLLLQLFPFRLVKQVWQVEPSGKCLVCYTDANTGVQWFVFYATQADVHRNLQDTFAHVQEHQCHTMLHTRTHRWGDTHTLFVRLQHGAAQQRPALDAEFGGAQKRTPPRVCSLGRFGDDAKDVVFGEYVLADASSIVVILGDGVELPAPVGAALAMTRDLGLCYAVCVAPGAWPTGIPHIWHEHLHALAAHLRKSLLKPLLKRRRDTESSAPNKRHVHNVETPVVTVFEIDKTEAPSSRGAEIAIPFAEPPVAPDMCENLRTSTYVNRYHQWRQDGWSCTRRTVYRGFIRPIEIEREFWTHPDYRETFSLNDMQHALFKLENENAYFAGRLYVALPGNLGRDARFCYKGKGKAYTRAEVRAHIKARQDRDFAAAGFTCTLVHDGGAMPPREEWRHATFEADTAFAREDMREAIFRMQHPTQAAETLAQRLGAPGAAPFWHGM